MIQKYLFKIIFIFFLMLSVSMEAQNPSNLDKQSTDMEELSIYPNPATADKIFITSKSNLKKRVEIYNVLGKKIHSAILLGHEMNISFLTSGIYMLKIEYAGETITRKLMVK